MYDPKLRERLYCVVAPTLMVWGAEDRIVPLEHGHAYQAGIEGLRLVTIEKSGHMPLVEQPQPTAHWMIDSSQLQLKSAPETKFSVNVRCLVGVDVSKLKVTQFDGRNKLKL